MKSSPPFNRASTPAALLAAAMALAVTAASSHAADGTWTQLSGGSGNGTWSDAVTSTWAGGIVAGGAGSTAYFNQVNITLGSTIALGAPRTIGNIVFGDPDLTVQGTNWSLTNGGNSANILTLEGATPTITVEAMSVNSLASITASISGTSGLTKNGVGILSLSGSNNYSGGTFVTSGTLRTSTSFSLGSGAVTVSSGAGLQVQNNITIANTVNLNGSGAMSLVSGTVVVSGTVNVQSAATVALGSAANSSLEFSGPVNLGANTLSLSGNRPMTFSGALVGTGTLNLNNIGGTTIITNDNSSTFSGAVRVDRSTVALGHNSALGTGALIFGVNDQLSGIRSTDTTTRTIANALTVVGTSNSTYNFGSTTGSVNGDLHFTNTGAIANGPNTGTRRFQVHNRTEIDGSFSGAIGITMQTGTGTLVLNGANTYTLATTVNLGTLIVDGSLGASSAVTVAAGATLGGDGTIGGATTLNGLLTPGEDGIVGSLDFGSSLNISGITTGIGALQFDLGSSSDLVNLTSGALTIGSGLLEWDDFSFTALSGFGAGTYTLFSTTQAISGSLGSSLTGSINGLDATISFADGGTDIVLTVVPEPSAVLLLTAGLAAVGLRRRRS